MTVHELHRATDPETEEGFRITLQVKAKHAVLLEASRAMGGVKKLAEHLGVDKVRVWAWIAMKDAPQFNSKKSPYYNSQRKIDLENKLFALTGKTLDEIWPESFRSSDFLDAPKTIEVTRHVKFKSLSHINPNVLLLPSAIEEAEFQEHSGNATEAMNGMLRGLTHREREIIRLRFGLGVNNQSHTLEECSGVFKISRERVRQIESKALKKIKNRIEFSPEYRKALEPIFGAFIPKETP